MHSNILLKVDTVFRICIGKIIILKHLLILHTIVLIDLYDIFNHDIEI